MNADTVICVNMLSNMRTRIISSCYNYYVGMIKMVSCTQGIGTCMPKRVKSKAKSLKVLQVQNYSQSPFNLCLSWEILNINFVLFF